MVSTVDQWTRQIVTIQNELNSAWMALAQDLNQAVLANFQQQWDHLLGNNPSAPNQALGTDVQQPGSGSTAHEAGFAQTTMPNVNPSSGGTTEQTSPQIAPHPLAPPQPHDYTWYPANGSFSASVATNWLLDGASQVGNPNPSTPGPLDNVIFRGDLNGTNNTSNAQIIWDGNKTWKFASMKLGMPNDQNGGTAYAQQQRVASNTAVEVSGDATGTSLYTNSPTSKLFVNFADQSSVFSIDANATITNMKLNGDFRAKFNINGGTTLIGLDAGMGQPAYADTFGVDLVVGSGATLIDKSYTPLKFDNSFVYLMIQGEMDVYYGTGTGATLIDINGNANDAIDVNGGTLKYEGGGGITDTFTAPVKVENDGTFMVFSYPTQRTNATLIVSGAYPGYTHGASVYLTDPVPVAQASSIQLSESATLVCVNDYYQDAGDLETTDITHCVLQDGASGGGTATIAGGELYVDTQKGTYGELDVNGSLNFAGTYYASVDGTKGGVGNCDLLNVTGTTNLQGSSLYVIVNNVTQQPQGKQWVIVQDPEGKNIQGDFAKPITVNPQFVLNAGVDQAHLNQYLLSC